MNDSAAREQELLVAQQKLNRPMTDAEANVFRTFWDEVCAGGSIAEMNFPNTVQSLLIYGTIISLSSV